MRSPGAANVLAGPRSGDLVPRLPVLRAALERNRDFRRDQLAQAGLQQRTRSSCGTNNAANREVQVAVLREIEALILAGARRALADIELALDRMRTGRYGNCRLCGTVIPLALLEAIPQTTLCLACRQPNRASA